MKFYVSFLVFGLFSAALAFSGCSKNDGGGGNPDPEIPEHLSFVPGPGVSTLSTDDQAIVTQVLQESNDDGLPLTAAAGQVILGDSNPYTSLQNKHGLDEEMRRLRRVCEVAEPIKDSSHAAFEVGQVHYTRVSTKIYGVDCPIHGEKLTNTQATLTQIIDRDKKFARADLAMNIEAHMKLKKEGLSSDATSDMHGKFVRREGMFATYAVGPVKINSNLSSGRQNVLDLKMEVLMRVSDDKTVRVGEMAGTGTLSVDQKSYALQFFIGSDKTVLYVNGNVMDPSLAKKLFGKASLSR